MKSIKQLFENSFDRAKKRQVIHIGKIIVISFEDGEEEALERVLSMLANEIQYKPMQAIAYPVLSFPGLEIRLHQRRVLKDGADIRLTRNEYGVLTYLTAYPEHVLTRQQIFERVWHMDSNSCLNAVSNTISRLRAKIETDRKNPVYIKTVQDGYMFDMPRSGVSAN